MKIRIVPDRCCGAGQCVVTAPEVFDQHEEDGIVMLLDEQPNPALHAAVRGAADACPTQTIIFEACEPFAVDVGRRAAPHLAHAVTPLRTRNAVQGCCRRG